LAAAHFLDAARLAPTDASIRFNLGLAYAEAGETDRAIEAFRNFGAKKVWNRNRVILIIDHNSPSDFEELSTALHLQPKQRRLLEPTLAALLGCDILEPILDLVELLVMGDPMVATTHVDLILRAKKLGIEVEINNFK
jgi:diphthamide biosynthesis methyltransferase